MSVSIRLKRMGRSNRPFYRVVVADTLQKREGAYLENLGWYDPLGTGTNFSLKTDRIDYWKGQGARISDTISSLLRKQRKVDQAKPAPQLEPEPVDVADTEQPAESAS